MEETKDGAGKIIKEYFRNLQKKSALKRKQNDSNTYKKMANLRWEKAKESDLKIELE
jgi:hypothetical protein